MLPALNEDAAINPDKASVWEKETGTRDFLLALVKSLEAGASFDDVGRVYGGKVVTIDDYLEIENRFIEITHAILEESGCKFVTLGYVENYRRKAVKEGKRVHVSHLDYYLRMALRGEAFIVFINRSRGVQFDWSSDCLYMHLYCRIPLNRLRSIVESRGLFLDPRSK